MIMNGDIYNRTFDKNIYKTPKLKTRTLCIKKTKSSYNTLRLSNEPASTSKKLYNSKTHLALVSRFLNHQNSVKQFNTINNHKMNKTDDLNNNSINKINKNKKLHLKKDESTTQINQSIKYIKPDNNKKNIIKLRKKEEINNMKADKKIVENKSGKNKIIKENELKTNKKENDELLQINKNKIEILKVNKDKIKEKSQNNKDDGINKKIKENKNNKLNIIDDKNEKKDKILKNKQILKRNDKKFNTISNIYEHKKEEKIIRPKKPNLIINTINIIPLPPRKSASPKNISHNLSFPEKIVATKNSPKSKKMISFGVNNPKEKQKISDSNDKENEKNKENKKNKDKDKSTKLSKKDKEKINKKILTPKKIEIKENSRNSNTNNKNINSAKTASKTKKSEFLYIPHIILDPLDVLKNQIEIILLKYENKIKTLNISNLENTAQYLIKKHHEEYANKLQEIYDTHESELIKIKNTYSFKIYKLSVNNEEEEEDEDKNKKKIEEMSLKRANEINELEKKFNERKKELKEVFQKKIEEMKKAYDFQKQKNLNKELLDQIRKNFVKIFNDKNMINKKGINFSLKDYKKCMKNNKNKSNKTIDTVSKK